MMARGIQHLLLYPEARKNRRPTAPQILKLFCWLERITVFNNRRLLRRCDPELTELQRRVLDLVGMAAIAG